MNALRKACAAVADRASRVRIELARISAYAASLPLGRTAAGTGAGDDYAPQAGSREELAAFWLTLDAINFGSGWFPTLNKRAGGSGYHTIATGLSRRFATHGPWTAAELAVIQASEVAIVLGQEAEHELMSLFAASLRDLGSRLVDFGDHGGRFTAPADAACGSAARLARCLGDWCCFRDTSRYQELEVPFLKRAQIAAADLARAGVAEFADLGALTMFADNLVPHVLRLDGVLCFDPALVKRIERGELLEHGSPEEVEIRACALHAVELIVNARGGTSAVEVDQLLWRRGQQPYYKAAPRHRSRCTAY